MSTIDTASIVQSILDSAPHFDSGGKRFYIVERCLVIEESRLDAYAESTLADPSSVVDPSRSKLSELVGATINGKLMRWTPGTVLSWSLNESSFPNQAQATQAAELTTAAGNEWNQVATDGEVDLRFEQVDADQDPLFSLTYHDFGRPGLYAVAFFPSSPVAERVVRVCPALFGENPVFDRTGVMRHELGHVLGFRHEHIRPEAPEQIEPWVVGNIGGEELTGYDSRSVMHYPMQGAGTLDFQLTQQDRDGFIDLYTLDASDVEEFAA